MDTRAAAVRERLRARRIRSPAEGGVRDRFVSALRACGPTGVQGRVSRSCGCGGPSAGEVRGVWAGLSAAERANALVVEDSATVGTVWKANVGLLCATALKVKAGQQHKALADRAAVIGTDGACGTAAATAVEDAARDYPLLEGVEFSSEGVGSLSLQQPLADDPDYFWHVMEQCVPDFLSCTRPVPTDEVRSFVRAESSKCASWNDLQSIVGTLVEQCLLLTCCQRLDQDEVAALEALAMETSQPSAKKSKRRRKKRKGRAAKAVRDGNVSESKGVEAAAQEAAESPGGSAELGTARPAVSVEEDHLSARASASGDDSDTEVADSSQRVICSPPRQASEDEATDLVGAVEPELPRPIAWSTPLSRTVPLGVRMAKPHSSTKCVRDDALVATLRAYREDSDDDSDGEDDADWEAHPSKAKSLRLDTSQLPEDAQLMLSRMNELERASRAAVGFAVADATDVGDMDELDGLDAVDSGRGARSQTHRIIPPWKSASAGLHLDTLEQDFTRHSIARPALLVSDNMQQSAASVFGPGRTVGAPAAASDTDPSWLSSPHPVPAHMQRLMPFVNVTSLAPPVVQFPSYAVNAPTTPSVVASSSDVPVGTAPQAVTPIGQVVRVWNSTTAFEFNVGAAPFHPRDE